MPLHIPGARSAARGVLDITHSALELCRSFAPHRRPDSKNEYVDKVLGDYMQGERAKYQTWADYNHH